MFELLNSPRRSLNAQASGLALMLAVLLAALLLPLAVGADVYPPADETQTVSLRPETAGVAPVVPAVGTNIPSAQNRILSERDVERYRRIVVLQKDGAWQAANSEIADLEDRMLMGHVLLQRYMHPKKYRSSYKELKLWLDDYADHPDAYRVHRLASKRRPKGYKNPQRPRGPRNAMSYADVRTSKVYRSPRKRSKTARLQVRSVKRYIKRNLRRDRLSYSESYLNRADIRRVLDKVERDDQIARVAGAWYYYGNDKKAYALAAAAAKRSRAHLSYPDWVAGLAAWRLGDMDKSAMHFEALANSKIASPWNLAAGGFWAARAHLAAKRPEKVNTLLQGAARHYRTFYGLIAARQLGIELDFDWSMPALEGAAVNKLRDLPAARRAIALAQIGRHEVAERELRQIYLAGDASMGPALLKLAYQLELPALQLRLARGLKRARDRRYDKALFPLPPWRPSSGFSIDQALLFAFARRESGFDTRARSGAGARGLMQLMPRTASHVAGDRSLRRRNSEKLYNPAFSLDLGQRYVTELLGSRAVRGDLFKLAVAYNAGPGNLRKWLKAIDHRGDPLLFIESLPSRETRIFVERVLANLWIYRERLNQDTPSLDAVATGHAPIYLSLDGDRLKVAENGRR